MTSIAETGLLPRVISIHTDDFINKLPTTFISSFIRMNKPDDQQLASIILFLQAILTFSMTGILAFEKQIINLAIIILSNHK
jgi:hypothetical protein